MLVVAILAQAATTENVDPITAILTRDWVNVGAWSLLIATWISILLGALREWWVPGPRHRRLEEASIKMADANAALTEQNGQLITANQITEHFFKETIPKRGEPKT